MVVADHLRSEMNYCRQPGVACRFFKPWILMEREDQFIKLVCEYLKLPVERVISKCRDHDLCEARQMISYLLKLHIKLSLSAIARKLLYKSHASVIRDIKTVNNYLEIEKTFIDRFKRLLIMAERLAWKLNKEERVKLPGYVFEQGDICWFWNDSKMCSFPVISLFDRSYFNEDLEEKFIALVFPVNTFDHCVYAGEGVLPERFRGITSIIPRII
jgi:hypothetical protein